ncbi:MAG: redoxin domain-containing protein [Pseudomonadota bacterium]|uniref:Redoxin domain-containing protein n=1 Tax=Candidatus Desulfatibia profunda TaxID=2841695 RepID=A0A8J6NSQ1_9BACT|nr:redoxin domain-containing protein [Candidatus Desulfatibia profunda]MBU0698776.1 redoxin domain-containing protein [Pseudomonadota bacterium]
MKRVFLLSFGIWFALGLGGTVNATEDLMSAAGILKARIQMSAPDFTLEDVSGNRVSSRDCQGKIVLLSFWATW